LQVSRFLANGPGALVIPPSKVKDGAAAEPGTFGLTTLAKHPRCFAATEDAE